MFSSQVINSSKKKIKFPSQVIILGAFVGIGALAIPAGLVGQAMEDIFNDADEVKINFNETDELISIIM
jgi:hypothetical protein